MELIILINSFVEVCKKKFYLTSKFKQNLKNIKNKTLLNF